MTVRLICGRAGAGKTEYILRSIADELKKAPRGREILLLVPEQSSYIYERALACDYGLAGFGRCRVTSFRHLVYGARKAAGVNLPLLTGAARQMALLAVLKENSEDLALFGRSAAQKNFAAALLQSLDELAAWQITPQMLKEAAERLGGEGGGLQKKLHDLSLIYGSYEAFCADSYLDPAAELQFLAREIAGGYLEGTACYIDGFATFSPLELSVIAALGHSCQKLEIALALEPELLNKKAIMATEMFFPLWQTARRLRQALADCSWLKPLLLTQKPVPRFKDQTELAFVEENLFPLYGGQKYAGEPQNIFLTSAPDRNAEIEYIAAQIKKLVRTRNWRYRDIALICRNLGDYQKQIKQVFTGCELPFFIDEQQAAYFHPLIEALRAALEIAEEGWQQQAVFRYLKSGAAGLSADEAALLENYCLAAGVKPWQWQAEQNWSFWPSSLGQADERQLLRFDELRRRVVAEVSVLTDELGDEPSFGALCRGALALLAKLKADEQLQAELKAALEAGDGRRAAALRQLAGFLKEIFTQAQTFLGELQLPLAQMREILDEGLTAFSFAIIPPGLDQVFVAAIERSRSPRLKAVFVVGLNSGVFPAKIEPDGILSVNERKALKAAGCALAPAADERQLAESYLCYIALTRSTEQLYLSYAREAEGEELAPSAVVNRIKKIFPGLTVNELTEGGQYQAVCGGSRSLAALARALSKQQAQEEALAPYWDKLQNWYAGKPAYAAQTLMLQAGLDFTAPQRLNEQSRNAVFGQTLAGSVSRLEKYLSCPFSYYANYLLKLKKRPLYEVTAAERGTIYHAVMEGVCRRAACGEFDWQKISPEELKEITQAELQPILRDFLGGLYNSSPRYRYLAARLLEVLFTSLLFVADQQKHGRFVPRAFEITFGKTGQLAGLNLNLSNGRRLELWGIIDRVDCAEAGGKIYYRVVDYKSADKRLKDSDVQLGKQLQLMTYLEVVLASGAYFSDLEPAPAGVYYSAIRDNIECVAMPASDEYQDAGTGQVLSGLTVEDPTAITLAIGGQGAPPIIPVRLNQDGSPRAGTTISPEGWAALRQCLYTAIEKAACSMLDGVIAAEPQLNSSQVLPCEYCEYAAVCGVGGELARKQLNSVDSVAPEEVSGDE